MKPGPGAVTVELIGHNALNVAPTTFAIEVKSAKDLAALKKRYPKRL